MVAKVRKILAVSKQATQNFDVGRFNLRRLHELEFATLENLNDSKDINRAWEDIKENIITSAIESLGLCVLKQCKPCLMKNVNDFWIKRSKLKCSGYRIQVKAV